MGILASKLDEPLNVVVDDLLCGYLDEDPGPSDCVKCVQDHHHRLRVPVFLFLVYKCVVFGIKDEGLVGFVPLGGVVD